MGKQPLIEFVEVKKEYPLESGEAYQALHGLNLSINPGELVAVTGPSGSGKSTTMHIMGALDMPSEGSYRFEGTDISRYNSDELARIRNQKIGFVFQAYNLLPRMTVVKNVERPMVFAGVKPEERRKKAMQMLELVQIADKADNMANHISGGQIQRVAIARALVMDPPLILADEPTGNLDTKTAKEIMEFLVKLNKSGRTIVIVTHDPTIAAYAKRQIVIVDGIITNDSGQKR